MTDVNGDFAVDVSAGPDGVPVVAMRGELDFATAPMVDESIAPVLASQPARVVFDLADLTFLDSSGIAVLVRTTLQAGTVTIRNPSAVVRRVIECTGLEQTLLIES